MLDKLVEKKIADFKASLGVTDLSEYVEIGREKQGYHTKVLEICFEQAHGQNYIRLRLTGFHGSGRTGRDKRSFSWPIQDPLDLSDMAAITGKVIEACQPGAKISDPRSALGKWFDNLTGSRLINSIPELARANTVLKEELSCEIREDKYGRHIFLRYQIPKKTYKSYMIPYSVWESLHAFFTA